MPRSGQPAGLLPLVIGLCYSRDLKSSRNMKFSIEFPPVWGILLHLLWNIFCNLSMTSTFIICVFFLSFQNRIWVCAIYIIRIGCVTERSLWNSHLMGAWEKTRYPQLPSRPSLEDSLWQARQRSQTGQDQVHCCDQQQLWRRSEFPPLRITHTM